MYDYSSCSTILTNTRLLEIIRFQTDIVRVGPDLGTIMTFIVHKAQELTESEGAVIELAEEGYMVYRAASGTLEHYLGLKLNMDGSLSGLCVKNAEMLYSNDTSTDDRVDQAACLLVNAKSMIVIPLMQQDRAVGVLKIASTRVNAFDDYDICTLHVISEMIAALIDNIARYAVEELIHKASHDALTGLHNTSSFYEHLHVVISESHFSVMIIDMDGLKLINDTYGHQAGDIAIKECADRIASVCEEDDVVARIGGDEFAVILHNVKNKNECDRFIERFNETFARPLYFEETLLPFGASIGYAVFPDDSRSAQEIVKIADENMYAMKKQHRADMQSGL